MLLSSLKIFHPTRIRITRIFFYTIKRSESNKSGDSTNNNGKKESKICNACQACPCECNPSAPTMYDCRKYGHSLPSNSIVPPFETLPDIPTGVFRCTSGEVLGRGANKGAHYQNPEYFSFQHMTFYDFHLALRRYRRPSAKTGRKN